MARWARRTASTDRGSGNCHDRLKITVPMKVPVRRGKSLPHCASRRAERACHRLWLRSAQPQDSQESLLELQELLLALMLFFRAVN